MNNQKTNSMAQFFINAFSSVILSLMAYPVVYSFEKGFLKQLDIPVRFITISSELFCAYFIPFFIILLFSFFPAILIYSIIPKKLPKQIWMIFPCLLMSSLLIIFHLTFEFYWLRAIATIVFIAMLLDMYQKAGLCRPNSKYSYTDRFLRVNNINPNEEDKDFQRFKKSLLFKYIIILFLFPLITHSAENAGKKSAKEQTTFNTTTINNEKYALITEYNGRDILKKILPKKDVNDNLIEEVLEKGYHTPKTGEYDLYYTSYKLIKVPPENTQKKPLLKKEGL
ncbi:MAG: hypothetical protein GY793_00150 [Proteobacteria bacterium]|nr:hypothetical protein [Pseudomonadota bacterium]